MEVGERPKRGEPVPRLNWGRQVDALKAAAKPPQSTLGPRGNVRYRCKLLKNKYLQRIIKESLLTDRRGKGGYCDTGRRLRCTSDQ